MSLYYQTCNCEELIKKIDTCKSSFREIVKTITYVWIALTIYIFTPIYFIWITKDTYVYNYLPLSGHIKQFNIESAMYNE